MSSKKLKNENRGTITDEDSGSDYYMLFIILCVVYAFLGIALYRTLNLYWFVIAFFSVGFYSFIIAFIISLFFLYNTFTYSRFAKILFYTTLVFGFGLLGRFFL
tara:strand:+ start:539 stop:850 length:312 start_codon:yes stop_codon:yes gene_type:complete